MGNEVLTTPSPLLDEKVRKHNPAFVLLYFACLGLAGSVFALGCLIIFVSALVLDFLGFLGLMGMALACLAWGKVKRAK